jgi:catechol 2,3-dioxygenase-like lactoylglutathione lyase family enzyme
MVKHFDHITVVVRDVERAKTFFGLLGFEQDKSVVISGETFSRYMGVDEIEAEHHTLVLAGASPRVEVQLLKYLQPEPLANPNISTLREVGFNHICFAVDDVEQELRALEAAGFERRNEVMDFHDRKLVFLQGPEGITVELAEWHGD